MSNTGPESTEPPAASGGGGAGLRPVAADAGQERIRVLRVIARLNMGGPALHVAYLSAGLRDRGYDTTLVSGSLALGEESMAGVAEGLGVPILTIPELHREISPLRDLRAVYHLADLIREVRPHILHTHTAKAGTIGRLAARLLGDAGPPIVVHTFHGHVLRGYFDPVRSTAFRLLERWLARQSTALIAVSPEVRDDLVSLGVAPAEKFEVVRLGIELDQRVGENGLEAARTRDAACARDPGRPLRRRLDRSDDRP